MTDDREIRALAQRIASIEARLGARGKANQLRSSSIEDGAILEYDESGQLTQVIGRQFDSTHGAVPVAGPQPPQPSGAGITLTSTPGGVVVRFNGTWADPGAVAPMDFSHFEVHVSEDPTVPSITFDNLRGTINTARGGDVVVPWPSTAPVYARVVARSTAGKASIPSDAAGPMTAGVAPQIFTQAEMPAPLGPRDRGVWFNQSRDGLPYFWNGTAWVEAPFGSGAIGQNSLVASDVLATNSITAPLFAAVIVLASTLIGGNPAGYHATLASDGIGLYAVDPNGAVVRVGGLGTGDDALTFVDPATAETTLSFTRNGRGSLQALAISGEDLNGDGEVDGGFEIYGREFLDHLGDFTPGAISSAYKPDALNGTLVSMVNSTYGLGEVAFTAEAGRQYMIIFDGLHYSSSTGEIRGLLSMRAATGGSQPTISSSTIASKFFVIPTSGQAYSAPALIAMGNFGATTTEVRILVTLERWSGATAGSTITAHTYTGGQSYRAPFRFFVTDMGRDLTDTYIPNNGGGVRGTVAAPEPEDPPPPASKKTYTSKWKANFTASYLGNGARSESNGPMYQGLTPYYTAGGNQKSLAGFTGPAIAGETGKTITQALAGATVNWVEIYLHCDHSHYVSGGMARIGYHGNTSAPGTAPNSQYGAFGGASFDRGQGRWIRLPASTFASWKNGTYRGITLGPGPNSDPLYYMRFIGGLSRVLRPTIRISYTR